MNARDPRSPADVQDGRILGAGAGDDHIIIGVQRVAHRGIDNPALDVPVTSASGISDCIDVPGAGAGLSLGEVGAGKRPSSVDRAGAGAGKRAAVGRREGPVDGQVHGGRG